MALRRGKSPRREQLKQVSLGDTSEARFAGTEEVIQFQNKHVEEFVSFLKKSVDSSVQIGNPETRMLSYVIPMTMKDGFKNFDSTLVAIKKKYPKAKFDLNKNGYQALFVLPFTSVFGPRDVRSGFLYVFLVVLWIVIAYMMW